MKNKIYLSGKITGIEELAPSLFAKAEEEVKVLGYEAVNPMTLNHNHDLSWHSYMKEDVKALCDCTHIYLLTNWKSSRGALIEFEIANHLGLEVIYQSTENPQDIAS